MKSIPEFATELGCTPQAVHKAKSRAESASGRSIIGVESPSDKRKILYNDEQLAEIQRYLNVSAKAPEVTIVDEIDNHSQSPSPLPTSFSLARFQTDTVRLSLDDPYSYVESLAIVIDQLDSAMTVAEQRQQQTLDMVRNANVGARTQLQRFRDRQTRHQIKSEVLTHLQNQAVGDFQSISDQVKELGLEQ